MGLIVEITFQADPITKWLTKRNDELKKFRITSLCCSRKAAWPSFLTYFSSGLLSIAPKTAHRRLDVIANTARPSSLILGNTYFTHQKFVNKTLRRRKFRLDDRKNRRRNFFRIKTSFPCGYLFMTTHCALTEYEFKRITSFYNYRKCTLFRMRCSARNQQVLKLMPPSSTRLPLLTKSNAFIIIFYFSLYNRKLSVCKLFGSREFTGFSMDSSVIG